VPAARPPHKPDRVLAPPQIVVGFQWKIEAVPKDLLLPQFHGPI